MQAYPVGSQVRMVVRHISTSTMVLEALERSTSNPNSLGLSSSQKEPKVETVVRYVAIAQA